MKNIIIVATGGTIAGSGKVGKATNYQAGKINIKEIIDSIPMINEVANLNRPRRARQPARRVP